MTPAPEKITFPAKLRPLGLYIAGNPGSGKTFLIQRLALRDISNGHGVCVIDPTGDLVNRLVHWIPKSRIDDTIFFDSSSPIPIDFFSYLDRDDRKVLVDELVSIFDFTTAPRAKPYLRRIIGTLLDYNASLKPSGKGEPASFLDILKFINDEKYREDIYKYCPRRRWEHMPKPPDFEAITSRMIPFEEDDTLAAIFGARRDTLNLWDVLQQNKIFLVNIKDTDTDLLLGSLIAAKIQQMIFRRRIILESERTPYYLYIDECGTILQYNEEMFKKVLTRARKYKLCLTLASQYPAQLPKAIQGALGTIGSLVLFNLKTQDARIFKDEISPYCPENLINLEAFHAIARIGNQVSCVKTPKYLGFSPASYAPSIMKRTVDNYACNTARVCPTKEDGNRTPPSEKGDEIIPTPPPVSSHGGKKKNP